MATNCPLHVSNWELERIRECESVVVREYETESGERFAQPVAWGDEDEMESQAAIPGLFLVPAGIKIVGQQAVPVAELLGLNESENEHARTA